MVNNIITRNYSWETITPGIKSFGRYGDEIIISPGDLLKLFMDETGEKPSGKKFSFFVFGSSCIFSIKICEIYCGNTTKMLALFEICQRRYSWLKDVSLFEQDDCYWLGVGMDLNIYNSKPQIDDLILNMDKVVGSLISVL